VTVIEEPVMRNYARMAKVAFWVAGICSALMTELITFTMWPIFWAIAASLVVGFTVGSVVSAAVIAWPVLRVIWWWLPEIAIATVIIANVNFGWLELTWHHVPLALRIVIAVLVLGTPAAFRPVRRYTMALAWCLISRHRIRTCFSEFIITNRYGTLPLILWAKPTPAGERMWIILRPGLALDDLTERSDRIAAACWASSVVIALASPSNAALLRIDIKRRDPLATVTTSPLTERLAGFIARTHPEPQDGLVALDLTDVTAEDVIDGKPVAPATKTAAPARPKWPSVPASVPLSMDDSPASAGEDLSDWL